MSKTVSECPEIEVQDVDHLGIVAGIVDEIGIIELIDELIPQHELEKISAGQIVKAIILNCMAFITSPMYLFHQFFEGKAIEHLLREGVKAEFISPKRIGRVMDELYKRGLTKLFAKITLEVVKKIGIEIKLGHLNSTSISVQGEYLESEESALYRTKALKALYTRILTKVAEVNTPPSGTLDRTKRLGSWREKGFLEDECNQRNPMNQYSALKQALKPHLGWHGARLSFLALFLLALLKVKTVNLKELALGFEGSALTDSHYKRLQRFFANFKVDYIEIA